MTVLPLRRARSVILAGALAAGCIAVIDGGGVADAAPLQSAGIACTGDAAPQPATVDYAALRQAPSFTATVAGASGVVRVPAGTVAFRDFTRTRGTLDGGVVGGSATGLIGAGRDRTTLQIAPRTSTRRGTIPKRFPGTNQLDVLRVVGDRSVLEDFALRGTKQGHPYNGLRVDRVRGLVAARLSVIAIPGTDHQPPGETFGINDNRTVGSRWSHVLIDGRGVAATGFGANSSSGVRLCDVTAEHNRSGMGFAFWQTRGATLIDCTAIGNGFAGFNFERVTGTVTLVRPREAGSLHGMRIASDRGSATFRVVDPVMTHGVWTVAMPRRWYHTTNRQRVSDITLVVHGRVRNDLLRIARY